jgi:hypothetical protein
VSSPLDIHTSVQHGGRLPVGERPPSSTSQVSVERETGWLRQQVRDRELGQRLDRRLPGQELPDVELGTLHCTRVPLRHHISGRIVMDFLPDGLTVVGDECDRLAERQAHIDRLRTLTLMEARPIAVVSALPGTLDLVNGHFDPGGLTFCDPELRIADALRLPTHEDSDGHRYRRLTLIARDGRIEKVIFPADEDLADLTRRILSWTRATRW